VPALQGSYSSLVTSLKDSAASVTSSRSRTRLRNGIVVAQVALSVLLVVCAVLFLRTLRNASAIDPGFSTRTALLATVDLLPAGYERDRGTVFMRTLLTRLRGLPGVESVSTIRRMPLGLTGTSNASFEVAGYTPAPGEEMSTDYSNVGSGYLGTMGIPLMEGRDIADGDVAGARDIVVINETLARRYFAGRPALGGQLKLVGRSLDVVGVARDGKYSTISEAPRPMIYVPAPQFFVSDATLVLATTGDPLSVLPGVQAAVRELDPNVPLSRHRSPDPRPGREDCRARVSYRPRPGGGGDAAARGTAGWRNAHRRGELHAHRRSAGARRDHRDRTAGAPGRENGPADGAAA
jgi:hypothetical protein